MRIVLLRLIVAENITSVIAISELNSKNTIVISV